MGREGESFPPTPNQPRCVIPNLTADYFVQLVSELTPADVQQRTLRMGIAWVSEHNNPPQFCCVGGHNGPLVRRDWQPDGIVITVRDEIGVLCSLYATPELVGGKLYATPKLAGGRPGISFELFGDDLLASGVVSVPWTGNLKQDARIYLDVVADILVRNNHLIARD